MHRMAPPGRTHLKILFSFSRTIADYIDSNGGRMQSKHCAICSISQWKRQNIRRTGYISNLWPIQAGWKRVPWRARLDYWDCFSWKQDNGLFYRVVPIPCCWRTGILDCVSDKKSNNGVSFWTRNDGTIFLWRRYASRNLWKFFYNCTQHLRKDIPYENFKKSRKHFILPAPSSIGTGNPDYSNLCGSLPEDSICNRKWPSRLPRLIPLQCRTNHCPIKQRQPVSGWDFCHIRPLSGNRPWHMVQAPFRAKAQGPPQGFLPDEPLYTGRTAPFNGWDAVHILLYGNAHRRCQPWMVWVLPKHHGKHWLW